MSLQSLDFGSEIFLIALFTGCTMNIALEFLACPFELWEGLGV